MQDEADVMLEAEMHRVGGGKDTGASGGGGPPGRKLTKDDYKEAYNKHKVISR